MKSSIMKHTIILSLLLISLRVSSQTVTDTMLFNNLVTQYVHSIEQADTLLGSEVWSHTDEVSFINPRGNEYGWNGVKNIYKFFGDNFTTRKLSFFDLRFADYGNVAWLEFYWIFDATMKINNSPVQTKGRETQIWRKVNSEWRLVHVHYSGMPVTGPGQGL